MGNVQARTVRGNIRATLPWYVLCLTSIYARLCPVTRLELLHNEEGVDLKTLAHDAQTKNSDASREAAS